jgi:aldehyde dehydrogenase (NAD+)
MNRLAEQGFDKPSIVGGEKKLLINGEWVSAVSGKTFATVDPATGQELSQIAEADSEDVDRAVSAARKAFDNEWSRVKPFDRQRILLRLADLVDQHYEELALIDTLEMGNPYTRTVLGRRRAVGMLRYYAGLATAISGETIDPSIPGENLTFTLKEPLGVVAGIIPWNGPIGSSIWKVAPALAAGCTVILKPSEEASLSPLRFGELALEAGVPPGVFNILTGGGQVGAALAAHMGIDKIGFTGSTATGQKIVQASAGNMKRLTMELGGKSPDIVFADADLDAAVPGAAMAIFALSGQICSAGSRLFVERKIYDEFVAKVAEFGSKLVVGDGLDPKSQLGPLVSARQLKRVISYIESGRSQGARTLAGGDRLMQGKLGAGYFLPPTVFTGVKDDMHIAREEIFGPVLAAIPFDDVDEVIRRGNDTPFGLGGGVWTRDINKAFRVAKGLKAGSVWVNNYQAMDPAVPFGGYKLSGYGKESGRQHIENFLSEKAVWVKYA